MESYDSWYQLPENTGKTVKLLASVLNGWDYVMLPGRRGMKFADLTQDCDVHFTKAFWSINENPNIRVSNVCVCTCVRHTNNPRDHGIKHVQYYVFFCYRVWLTLCHQSQQSGLKSWSQQMTLHYKLLTSVLKLSRYHHHPVVTEVHQPYIVYSCLIITGR